MACKTMSGILLVTNTNKIIVSRHFKVFSALGRIFYAASALAPTLLQYSTE
jgi:hypothetical protein